MSKTAFELLRESADIFEERSKAYGDSYKSFGGLVKALFPEGLLLKSEEDFNRYGVLSMIMSKLHRYANNFQSGGHRDSLIDLSTYAAMLNELDGELPRSPLKLSLHEQELCESIACKRTFMLSDPECIACMGAARAS